MKLIHAFYLTALAILSIFAIVIPTTGAMAYQPNQGVTPIEFAEARGCVFIDKGGYITPKGGCPALLEFNPPGSRLVDPDGIPGNGDEYTGSDN